MTKLVVERDGDDLIIHIPLQFRRRGGRKEIIAPEGLEDSWPAEPRPPTPLAHAVTRAHHWQQLLDTDKVKSIRQLAKLLDIDRSHVSKMLNLTLLAPDLVTAIVEGREPGGMSVVKLLKGTSAGVGRAERHLLDSHATS